MKELTQRNYLTVRNKYTIPTIKNSKIGLRDYQHLKLKKAVFENFIDVSNPHNNDYLFKVPKSIIDKSRLSEIEQFFLRAKFQQSDFVSLKEEGTPSWMITTQYYRLFFLTTCLQRILNIGYFWVNKNESNQASTLMTHYIDSFTQLGSGNFRYIIEQDKSDQNIYNVFMSQTGPNLHELSWLELKTTLNKFIENSNNEERKFLEGLKKAYNKMGEFSPSTIRNEVNYSSETAIKELNNQIFCFPINKENIISLVNSFNERCRINSGSKLTIIISEYLDILITALLKDIYSRNKNSCKLIIKYERKKSLKLIT